MGQREGDAAIGSEIDPEEFEWELGVSNVEAAAGDYSLRV